MRGLVAVLAAALLLPSVAFADKTKAVILPVTAQNVGTGTLQVVHATIIEKLPDLEIAAVPTEEVVEAVKGCESPGCSQAEDALEVGKELGADFVVSTHIAREGKEILVRMVAFNVAESTSVQEEATTTKAGILTATVKLVGKVLPAPDPCEDIDCSDNGECYVEDGEPWCRCDKGYVADGLDCKRRKVKTKEGAKELMLDQETARPVRGLATAGAVFGAASLITYVASYISLCAYLEPSGRVRLGYESAGGSWLAFQIASLSTHVIGIPLLLSSRMKARKALGLAPSTTQSTTGWILYAASIATMTASLVTVKVGALEGFGFAFPTVTIPILVACTWVSIWESRQAVKSAPRKASLPTILPMVSALPGGAALGVAGTF